MSVMIKTYGARGSFPLQGAEYSRHGGNTSCFYLNDGNNIVLDAGTGILQLGKEMPAGPIHILLSHLHMDHIQGLPGFRPLFEEGREIHIYASCKCGSSPESLLDTLIAPPFWPVRLSGPEVKAKVFYHTIEKFKSFLIGNTEIKPVPLNHPDDCLGFIVKNERKIAYLLDCELDGRDTGVLELELEGCDLAIMDASYLPGQVFAGFGHSSWKQCMELAEQCHVSTVLMAHFSDQMTDELLEEQQLLAEEEWEEECIFVREGDLWELKKASCSPDFSAESDRIFTM